MEPPPSKRLKTKGGQTRGSMNLDFATGMKQWFVKLNKKLIKINREIDDISSKINFDDCNPNDKNWITYFNLIQEQADVSQEFEPFKRWFMRNRQT